MCSTLGSEVRHKGRRQSGSTQMKEAMLEVKRLKTHFFTDEGVIRAVDGVDFSVKRGETVGLVGESGCGKSVTGLSILRVVPQPPGKILEGQILWEGKDLLALGSNEMRRIRGRDISMILQDPMTNLNPVYTVGEQIGEVFRLHEAVSRKEAIRKAKGMLRRVQIPAAERRVNEYPHQLSGGMRQRVMIAIALACNPRLLIADEPTTALDVTIQAQILDLMDKLKAEMGMSIILITHDLGIVAETAQRVIVMYAGEIVEEAKVHALFGEPMHPYTRGLLHSIPRVDKRALKRRKLEAIPGVVPSMLDLPRGCRFAPRCQYSMSVCLEDAPPLFEKKGGHKVRCWLSESKG